MTNKNKYLKYKYKYLELVGSAKQNNETKKPKETKSN
jgi:hypothetical protein